MKQSLSNLKEYSDEPFYPHVQTLLAKMPVMPEPTVEPDWARCWLAYDIDQDHLFADVVVDSDGNASYFTKLDDIGAYDYCTVEDDVPQRVLDVLKRMNQIVVGTGGA